jgi:uncharacterized protein (DUF427 family)
MPTAQWNGVTLADTTDTVVVEGNQYFPIDAVDPSLLKRSNTTTVCGWKGTANYYTIVAGGEENVDAAWYYTDPKPAAASIKGRVAFWKGVKIV